MNDNISALQISTNSTLNFLLQKKSIPYFPTNTPSYILSPLFKSIEHSSSLYPVDNTNPTSINISPSTFSHLPYYISVVMRDIQSFIAVYLAPVTHAVILHGSMADGNIVRGWSDVDVLYVLKMDRINDIMKLRERFLVLEDFLYTIDPHQHHGIQYITTADLRYYPDLFYPHQLLSPPSELTHPSLATLIYPTSSAINLTIHPRDCRQEEIARFQSIRDVINTAYGKGELRHHAYNNEYLRRFYENMNTMYQLKYYLSVIVLLPVLWLNLAGIVCSKREALRLAKIFLSEESWTIVEQASEVRRRWTGEGRCIDNRIPDWVKEVLSPNYFERGKKLVDEMYDRFQKPTFPLIQNYYHQIKQFCDENRDKDVIMCGSVTNPGRSDIDLLVLDTQPTLPASLSPFLKPVTEYSGNVLVHPRKLYAYLPYIIDLRLTPLHTLSPLPELKVLEGRDVDFFKYVELLEWYPERLLLTESLTPEILDSDDVSDREYLIRKSLLRSVKIAAEVMELKEEKEDHKRLREVYPAALELEEKFEESFNLIQGNVSGEVNVCSYYSFQNRFPKLMLYLYYITTLEGAVMRKLNERLKLRVTNFWIDPEFARFIQKRWKVVSELYDWFVKKGYDYGVVKWGWLLR